LKSVLTRGSGCPLCPSKARRMSPFHSPYPRIKYWLALPSPLCEVTSSPGTVSSNWPGRYAGASANSASTTTPSPAVQAIPMSSSRFAVTTTSRSTAVEAADAAGSARAPQHHASAHHTALPMTRRSRDCRRAKPLKHSSGSRTKKCPGPPKRTKPRRRPRLSARRIYTSPVLLPAASRPRPESTARFQRRH
jgi:hypothetical protein